MVFELLKILLQTKSVDFSLASVIIYGLPKVRTRLQEVLGVSSPLQTILVKSADLNGAVY